MYRAQARDMLIAFVAAISGCGAPSDPWLDARPETALASGIVTYLGKPLEGAVVVFQPQDPHGVGASALTDSEGKFELQTFPPDFGAVPGLYSVTIMKTEIPQQKSLSPGNADDPGPVFAVSVIPERYSRTSNSGLKAEIPESGADSLDFDLEK